MFLFPCYNFIIVQKENRKEKPITRERSVDMYHPLFNVGLFLCGFETCSCISLTIRRLDRRGEKMKRVVGFLEELMRVYLLYEASLEQMIFQKIQILSSYAYLQVKRAFDHFPSRIRLEISCPFSNKIRASLSFQDKQETL